MASSTSPPPGDDCCSATVDDGAVDVTLWGATVSVTQGPTLAEAGLFWSINTALASFCARPVEALAAKYPSPSLLELGAGTGALSLCAAKSWASSVTATDLSPVLPQLEANFARNGVASSAGGNRIMPLEWGNEDDVAAIVASRAASVDPHHQHAFGSAGFAVIAAVETVYFGGDPPPAFAARLSLPTVRADRLLEHLPRAGPGWDLFTEDTRRPLLDTIAALSGPATLTVVAFVVRMVPREVEFLQWALERFDIEFAPGVRPLDQIEEGDEVLAMMRLRAAAEPSSADASSLS